MDSISSANCRLILNEVFECGDLDALLHRGDQFFALLPEPGKKPDPSDHSPYNRQTGQTNGSARRGDLGT
jgi:hypothetical protein